MIGALNGTVISLDTDSLILDVNGVGYEIFAAPRLLDACDIGAAKNLAIETMVREDFIKLYGFAHRGERACFRFLQNVQGVGAKAALAIMQVLTTEEMLDAIAEKDDAAFARAQGVGKKIATRIVVELSSKLPTMIGEMAKYEIDDFVPAKANTTIDTASKSAKTKAVETPPPAAKDQHTDNTRVKLDAASALQNLGFDAIDARQAAAKICKENPEANLDLVIKLALKELSPQ